MKKIAIILLVFPCLTIFLLGEKELIEEEGDKNWVENGDFSNGKKGWKTSGNIETLEDGGSKNEVLKIKLHKKKRRYLSTVVELKEKGGKEIKGVVAQFRVKGSDDYQSFYKKINDAEGALKIKIGVSGKDYVYYQRNVSAKNEWVSMPMRYTLKGGKQIYIGIEVLPGEGFLFFDDFVVQAISQSIE